MCWSHLVTYHLLLALPAGHYLAQKARKEPQRGFVVAFAIKLHGLEGASRCFVELLLLCPRGFLRRVGLEYYLSVVQAAELVFVVDEVAGGEEGEAGVRMAVGLR